MADDMNVPTQPAQSSDIVTRLLALNHPDASDGADEIERLVRKLDELDYYIEHSSTCATRYGKLRDCNCGLEEARRG